MAWWDTIKQAPIAAIGRKVQSWLQPQQAQTSQSSQSSGTNPYTNPTAPYGLGGYSTPYGTQYGTSAPLTTSPSYTNPTIPNNSGGGGGGNGGGGGGEQPPYSPNVQNQTVTYKGVTWKGNPGGGWTMVGQASTPQVQAAATPTPTFNMGAFTKNLQDQMGSIGRKVSTGIGDVGSTIKQGGTNLLNAIKSRVQPLPNYKVGAYDENAPTTPETKVASMANPVKGTWGSGEGMLQDRGWTEKLLNLLGFKGSQEATTLYNPAAAQTGQIGSKVMVSQGGETLPETPPALGGGGQVLGISNPYVASLIEEAFSAQQTPITPQEVEDLDVAMQRMSSELGIDKAQAAQQVVNEQIIQVGDSIEAIDAEVKAEGENVLMTEAQRGRLIEARARPLRDQLAKLVRSAQYLGVNMDNLYKMLNQRMAAKQQTTTNQLQANQLAQQEAEARRKRQLDLLPYLAPKAQTLKSGGGTGEMTLEQLLG